MTQTTQDPYLLYTRYMSAVVDTVETMKRRGEYDSLELRFGQVAYNTLAKMHPEFAELVLGTDIDPYYCDEGDKKVTEFYAWIFERLIETTNNTNQQH